MRSVVYEYKSSFDSTIGDFTLQSSNDNDDEQTVETGQNAPGEPTTNDWLKITINSDPGGAFFLRLDTHVAGDWLPAEYSRKINDLITIDYKLHLTGDFGNNMDPVLGLKNIVAGTSFFIFDNNLYSPVPLGTTVESRTSHKMGGNDWNQTLVIIRSGMYGLAPNAPDPGAVIYIKDVCVRLWRY